jgi:hypothetical protein
VFLNLSWQALEEAGAISSSIAFAGNNKCLSLPYTPGKTRELTHSHALGGAHHCTW